MAIDTELAKRLRSYRNFKHLTQKDVAAAFKCSSFCHFRYRKW